MDRPFTNTSLGRNNNPTLFQEKMVVYSIDTITEFGASAIGMQYDPPLSSYKLREWNSAFGVRPEVCCDAWALIHAQAAHNGHSITHLFWCLHFMRSYQVENECARSLKTNPKTLRERVKAMMKLLSCNMPRVVSCLCFFCSSRTGKSQTEFKLLIYIFIFTDQLEHEAGKYKDR